MTEPGAMERQMRKGWDDLSEELKNEYGKEYWEEGMPPFSAFLPFLKIAILWKLIQEGTIRMNNKWK